MTNILAFLHTTMAYKAAALQLMVGEANFAAKQFNLNVSMPIVISDTNDWEVISPLMGVGGMLLTSNYDFAFMRGRFLHITEKDWLKKLSPPAKDLNDLTNRVSLLDTNGAYQLATQWLARLSVNISSLERKFPPRVEKSETQVVTTNRSGKMETIKVPIPIYLVSWGKAILPTFSPGMNPAFVRIYGPTKELLNLGFRGDMLEEIPFDSPPFVVTNAAELLGPLPPPRHFVEELLGGKEAYETVVNPDKVEAWLLNSSEDQRDNGLPPERVGPKKLRSGFFGTGVDKAFSDILLDFDSYAWTEMKLCSPDFGLRLRYTHGKDVVEFQLCYDCDILEVSHNGHVQQENFDFVHDKLVKAVQGAFPFDEKISKLELDLRANEHRKEYERMLNQ
jgi:hypothetical protein